MRLLLDTHVLIWAASDPDRLAPAARQAILAPRNDLYVSPISIWEISIKQSLGRIDFPLDDIEGVLDALGLEVLAISVAHAVAAGSLPRHHNDPFDRMLVAQARCEGLRLVTADAAMRSYDVPLLQAE